MAERMVSISRRRTRYDYTEPDIGNKIIEEYGYGIAAACVAGICAVRDVNKLNEFCSHMAAGALEGDSLCIALSCFAEHGEPFNNYLPVPIEAMSEKAFEIFVNLLSNSSLGLSKSVKRYLIASRDDVEEKANERNPHALWLMALWYVFDEVEHIGISACMKKRLFWYEEAAFEGCLPAMQSVAELYDTDDKTEASSMPREPKKAAFWYRHAALNGDATCAYNLGVMYALGDFVKKNPEVARMWLSLARKNSEDPELDNFILGFANQFAIRLVPSPDLGLDPELDSITSEFQDVYQSI